MGKLARTLTIGAIVGIVGLGLTTPVFADHWENFGPYSPKAACQAAGEEEVAAGAIEYACKWIGHDNYNLLVHYAN